MGADVVRWPTSARDLVRGAVSRCFMPGREREQQDQEE